MYNYITHNNSVKEINIHDTCLQDHITTTYTQIVLSFGEPSKYNDGYKTDAEWDILFNDEIVCTLYNYKNGKNYNGKNGTPTKELYYWNIGGITEYSADLINDVINQNKLICKVPVHTTKDYKDINKRLSSLGVIRQSKKSTPYPFNIIISFPFGKTIKIVCGTLSR